MMGASNLRRAAGSGAAILWTVILAAILVSVPGLARSATVELTGRFLYQDRIWGPDGYTGQTQDLPIRRADVEAVANPLGAVLATGSTDADGNFSLSFDLSGPRDIYIRCLSSTDNHPDYHIKVVDRFVRVGGTVDLSSSTIFAIATPAASVDPGNPPSWDFGAYVIEDLTGSGIAQAYNILDNAVDCFDYLDTPAALGSFPDSSQFVVYGWNGTSGSAGSNYYWQGIYLTSTATDTDGWADTVILHETGHWASDMFGRDDNPGGTHYIGDNAQDPRLSYGEGYATFFCALVREFRAPRLNDQGVPVDDHVSYYADLGIPPALPTPGGLEFSYDFETGLRSSGIPIGQIGSANETNVTSVMWDLVDGMGTPDESPGVDDEPGDEAGDRSWDVTANYMPERGQTDWLTIEDFHDGWFVRNGPGFMRTAVDSSFIGLGGMPFRVDEYEPDDLLSEAPAVVPLSYTAGPGGGVVINECFLGVEDRVEIYNSGDAPVDLTGWKIHCDRNTYDTRTFTFPSFTLYPGTFVVVHEGGNIGMDTPAHLYDGAFYIVWENGDDGACTLVDNTGTAVDFVRWDKVSGDDPSQTPVPPGLTFTGSVFSPPLWKTLGRDRNGTDTDDAGDFSAKDPSMNAPNFLSVPHHTIYPEHDVDMVRLDLDAGDLLVVQAYAAHSAGDLLMELLDGSGQSLGMISTSNGIQGLAEIQLLAPSDTTVYAKVSNQAPYTFYAPLDLTAYVRPFADVLGAPVAFIADPDNAADVGDTVALTWFNGGAYDSVQVRRDGDLIASLPGGATSYEDTADRGLYEYQVMGFLGGAPTEPASYRAFAGVLSCSTEEDFESGTGNLVLDAPWDIDSSIAHGGLYSLTDSPLGDYANDTDVSAEIIEPAAILSLPKLEFDHICITEAGYDFGYVEISTDFGNHWTQLAAYDMGDHPEWSDGTADPGDWIHETINLLDYVGQTVRVRFRLVSDQYVTEDGWYIDDVHFSEPDCVLLTDVADGDAGGRRAPGLQVGPNPFGTSVRLALTLPRPGDARIEVFDAGGRLVRRLHDGPLPAISGIVWDGRSDGGQPVAAGLYLIRASGPGLDAIRRVVRVR